MAFLGEEFADRASELLTADIELLAPDLLLAEVGNVVWKLVRRGQLSAEEGGEMLGDVLRLPIDLEPMSALMPAVLEIAIATDRTVYDCLYLACAIRHEARLVTADERFVNAIQAGPFASHASWIGSDDL